MAMVNPILTLANANVKDSRWLTLEVCREFQRNKCTRSDTECKFAHPPPHVEVQNGRVTACFDSIKGKCQRKDPPCKYLHPPQHLREQLLQNGRNNLILKNLQLQAAQAAFSQPIVPGLIPVGHPYVGTAVPTSTIAFNPYLNTAVPAGALPTAAQTNGESTMLQQQTGVIQTAIPATQAKLARPDRLEVCREFQRGTCTRQPSECRYAHPPDNVTIETSDNCVTVCMDYIKGKCTRDSCRYFHPPPHLQAQIKANQQRANAAATAAAAQAQALTAGIPGVYPYKRVAIADAKSGLPVYQPNANMATYQQLMQLQQQQFIPVTSVRSLHPQYLGPYFTYNHDNWYVDASQGNCWTPSQCAEILSWASVSGPHASLFTSWRIMLKCRMEGYLFVVMQSEESALAHHASTFTSQSIYPTLYKYTTSQSARAGFIATEKGLSVKIKDMFPWEIN
ncbi:hypothetical protein ACJMK2_017569 [Sinanodonta woodiana]|uniref:C3H1-type domain-containing protein n=1 Tax=Sinanodonta woodiana TaxID=1069815 RepID=A0ABD3UAR2_SINWO